MLSKYSTWHQLDLIQCVRTLEMLLYYNIFCVLKSACCLQCKYPLAIQQAEKILSLPGNQYQDVIIPVSTDCLTAISGLELEN